MPNPYTFVNWGLLGEGKEPVATQQEGWVVKRENTYQDEYNWDKYEFHTEQKFYLNYENALKVFFSWLENTRLFEPIQEYYMGRFTDGGWISPNFDKEDDLYGDFDALPSLDYLYEKGYLPLSEIPGCNEYMDKAYQNYEADLGVAEDEEIWDLMMRGLIEMANQGRGTSFSYEIEHMEVPQNTYFSSLTQWNGPKWEDKDKGDK